MNQLTKQQQKKEAWEAYTTIADPAFEAYEAIKDEAFKAYLAITDPALKAYQAKIAEINARPDEVAQIITKNGRRYKLIEENK